MQEEIKKIELVLENCEVITIDGEYIGSLSIEDITYSINRVACNYIAEMYTCSHFSMSANRSGGVSKTTEFTIGTLDEERNQYSRLESHPDITSIYIHFKDKEEPKQIYLKWNENSEYSNSYQKTYINKFGDIFIVVDKKKVLEDVFEEMEDEGYMDYIWSMYS